MIPKEERCKANVPDGGRSVSFHRCNRRVVKDGYCKIHHPDYGKNKRDKLNAIWDQEYKINDLSYELADLHRECVNLVKDLGKENAIGYNETCKLLADKVNELEKMIEEERKVLEKMKEK